MRVIIIGAGPAGISAALYARRGGAEVTVAAKGAGALSGAEWVENYYGFAEPVSGAELERQGIAGAKRLGVGFEEDEIVAVRPMDTGRGFLVEGVRRSYEGDAVIFAAGARRGTLSLPGIREFEGRGVSFCASCDAFFYRGKKVAVIGAGAYALHEARILLPHAAHVCLLSNGVPPAIKIPNEIAAESRRIARIEGERHVRRIVFADGTEMEADGVFIAIGTPGATELAQKLGILLNDGKIVVDEHMATNVPGVYAAGDCTGGLLQIAKAVYEGAEAGLAVLRYLQN